MFKYTPIIGTNNTRNVKLIDNADMEKNNRLLWSDTKITLTECRRSMDGQLSEIWDSVNHEWTITLTEDFMVLTREEEPVMKWEFRVPDEDRNCDEYWPGTDISAIKFRNMDLNLNYDAWFYTSWDPAQTICELIT